MTPSDWIKTADGSFTKIHPEHGQSYHSLAGAYSECEDVFLRPVIEHFQDDFAKTWQVLDVGFGLGLNWLCFVDYALRHNLTLRIDSLECDQSLFDLPEPLGLQNRVLPESLRLLAKIKNEKEFCEKTISAKIHLGDAKTILQTITSEFLPPKNIILQDAFSSKIHPELWDEEYFQCLSRRCLPGAVLTTYSAASSVQRALRNCGFVVEKYPGFGGKRERVLGFKAI